MGETITTVLAIILLFVGLPVLILWFKDRKRTRQRLHEQSSASRIPERQAYGQRILDPDWACIERYLRRPVPQALRVLYAERELISRRDLSYDDDHVIGTFEPLDEQAILNTTRWLGFEAVAIATTDFGDVIYLRPGADEGDTLFLTHHDGGDTEVFAESVSELLAALRRTIHT